MDCTQLRKGGNFFNIADLIVCEGLGRCQLTDITSRTLTAPLRLCNELPANGAERIVRDTKSEYALPVARSPSPQAGPGGSVIDGPLRDHLDILAKTWR
jgi:hypothetical protein